MYCISPIPDNLPHELGVIISPKFTEKETALKKDNETQEISMSNPNPNLCLTCNASI